MKAKEKLITAFFDLLTIKDFQDITVSELCLVANVHRTTFYAYYDNIVELLVDAKEYAINKFKDAHIRKNDGDEYISMEILVPYLDFIKDNSNLFKAYLRNFDVFKAIKDFENIYENYFLKDALNKNQNLDKWMVRKITEFFMCGMIGLIKAWLDDGCIESSNDLARVIVNVRNINQ